jgi:hypothetical protein
MRSAPPIKIVWVETKPPALADVVRLLLKARQRRLMQAEQAEQGKPHA